MRDDWWRGFGIRPVPLAWANALGRAQHLPQPGDPWHFGLQPPGWAEDGTRYMLPDGTVWEYLGISGYETTNRGRINGWEDVTMHLRSLAAINA